MRSASRRAQQAAETRQLVIGAARRCFAEQGYADTSIDDILAVAGVARGALYHHFDGKQALFAAVYEQVQSEVLAEVLAAATGHDDPWDGVSAGLAAFFDACLDRDFRRIVVLDSVVVLQASSWEGGAEPAELAVINAFVAPLAARVAGGPVNPQALSYVTLGGLYGAALHLARSRDRPQARADVAAIIDALLAGVRGG